MSPQLGTLGLGRPPAPRHRVCRVCGCTDLEGCLVECKQRERGHPARPGTLSRYHQLQPARTCFWVEPDLCSRCIRPPARMTRRQMGEITRIESRWGWLRLWPALDPMCVQVELAAHNHVATLKRGGFLEQIEVPAPVVTINPWGVVVSTANPRRSSHRPDDGVLSNRELDQIGNGKVAA